MRTCRTNTAGVFSATALLPVLLAVLLAVLSGGCAADEAGGGTDFHRAVSRHAAVTDFTDPAWALAGDDADPPVAVVNGVPLAASRLTHALRADGFTVTPEVMLERLIEMEVLAQEAFRAGYDRPDIVGPVRDRALVAELLAERVLRPPAEAFFTDDLIREIYRHPSVRVKFDHVDIFRVYDGQFLCCATRPDDCNPAEFERCMEETAPAVQEVYAAIRDIATDTPTFVTLIKEWEHTFRRLHLKNYSFFYNVNLPHDQQRGYNIVNENVARAAMGLQPGQLAAPVRSRNGWHILFLDNHTPEQHKGPDDPTVKREIVEKLLPQRRAGEYESFVRMLRDGHTGVVFAQALALYFSGVTDGDLPADE